MYKSNVGDFPLKVHPCRWWWVRYAVACNRDTELHNKEMWEKLKSIGFEGSFSYTTKRGTLSVNYWEDKKEKELSTDSEAYKIILEYNNSPEWIDCPYEDEDQSVCEHYEVSSFYAKYTLEELRQRKGYEL